MHVVVTGGAGFLGSRLARELLAAGSLPVAGGAARPLSRLTLIDRAPAPPDLASDERVSLVLGDLAEVLDNEATVRETLGGAEVVFHLAAAVSGECEAHFDLGPRANLQATEALLASCRALGTTPVVVFSSSVAVFGGSAETVITDDTRPDPQTSYGVAGGTGGGDGPGAGGIGGGGGAGGAGAGGGVGGRGAGAGAGPPATAAGAG